MVRKRLIPILFAVLAAAGPALADEVVHFTNGTVMPILLHEVDGDMIIVVLEGRAEMAFPLEQIERIEDAEGQVVRPGSMPKNRVVSSGATPVQGLKPTVYRREKWDVGGDENLDVQRTPGGVATLPLMAGSSVRVTGRQELAGRPAARTADDGNVIGAVPYGIGYRVPFRGTKSGRMPVGLNDR
jgi:hypothetical protein